MDFKKIFFDPFPIPKKIKKKNFKKLKEKMRNSNLKNPEKQQEIDSR